MVNFLYYLKFFYKDIKLLNEENNNVSTLKEDNPNIAVLDKFTKKSVRRNRFTLVIRKTYLYIFI